MSEIALPKVDRKIVSKKDLIVSNLKRFTDKKNVLSELDEISLMKQMHLQPTKIYL